MAQECVLLGYVPNWIVVGSNPWWVPGAVAYAHIHVDFEVMLYILAGRVRHENQD